jgi:glycerophosphoryl diester phosphodiesterase
MGVTFDKQGHRGCRGLMPENTIGAFKKAIDLGVTTLKLDTVITADNKVLVSHEPYFSHEITTKPDGDFVNEKEERLLNIYKMKYAETLAFDVGLKAHPRFPKQQKVKANKPLLADVFMEIEKYLKLQGSLFINYNIETKCLPETDGVFHPTPQEFIDFLMRDILQFDLEKYVTIQSFDVRTLQYLKAYYTKSSVQISLLVEADNKLTFEEQIDNLGFLPHIYSPEYILVNKQVIDACHKRGIKIIPWTVNDKQTMELLKNIGVDGLISDYPNLY